MQVAKIKNEGQPTHTHTHTHTHTQRERERERERQTKKQTLNYRKQTDAWGGEAGWEWVKQVMRIKECTCDEQQVMYGRVESLSCTPEANIILLAN